MPDEPRINDDLNSKVADLVKEMMAPVTAATTSLSEAAKSVADAARPAASASQPGLSPEQFKARFNEIASEKGLGEALEFYTNTVSAPIANAIVNQAATHAAKAQKSAALADPELGALMKRSAISKRVNELAKERGDGWIAEHGYESLIREVSASDPAFQKERDERLQKEAVDAARVEWEKVHPTAAAPGPPQEGVYAGAVHAPGTPAPSREAQIAAVEITEEEAAVNAEVLGVSKDDLKRQRFERLEWHSKLGGAVGVKRAGGIPICDSNFIMTGKNTPPAAAAGGAR